MFIEPLQDPLLNTSRTELLSLIAHILAPPTMTLLLSKYRFYEPDYDEYTENHCSRDLEKTSRLTQRLNC